MRTILGVVAGLFFVFAPATSSAGEISNDVILTMQPSTSTVTLGDNLEINIDVTNTGDEPTEALVVHIDITDPSQTSSVDPEDWTATLSKRIGSLDPGQTSTVNWRIQPISGGTFSVYAIALAPNVDTIAASNVLHVVVDAQRSLNPNGILPVAIGAPALVGGLLAVQIHFARRNRSSSTTS